MDEIEVSDEMTKAGIDAWLIWEKSDDAYPENLINSIYRAMERVHRDQFWAAVNARPTLVGQMIANSPELQAAQQRATEAVRKHIRWAK